MHGCKWTASFDNVVQLESQAHDVVLQGGRGKSKCICFLRSPSVSHHQQRSEEHGKHANTAEIMMPPLRIPQSSETMHV